MKNDFVSNQFNTKMPSQDIYVNPCDLGLTGLPRDQWEDGVQEDILKRLTAHIKNARRGDTISLEKAPNKYRNDWTYMWDGEKAVPLDHILDEYGTVPPTFKVTDTEFSPDWWINTITHNGIFWLSDEIKSRMKFKEEEDQIVADFLIGDVPWRCYVDYPDNPDMPENLEDLAMRENVYFQIYECECTVPSSSENPHVMYLYIRPEY